MKRTHVYLCFIHKTNNRCISFLFIKDVDLQSKFESPSCCTYAFVLPKTRCLLNDICMKLQTINYIQGVSFQWNQPPRFTRMCHIISIMTATGMMLTQGANTLQPKPSASASYSVSAKQDPVSNRELEYTGPRRLRIAERTKRSVTIRIYPYPVD